MATLPSPPEDPVPPGPNPGGPALRPAFVGVAAALTWLVGAAIAWRILGIYPLPLAKETLFVGWVLVGVIAWGLAATGRRPNAWIAVVAAGLVPIILVTTVPGIRRPTQYPIPGGGSYAFSAAPHGTYHLFLIRGGDGAHAMQLTNNGWPDLYPQLSPDGTKIVYVSARGGSVLDLRLMTLDGSGRVTSDRTLVHASVDVNEAQWSADGTSVFFVEPVDGLDTLMRADLHGNVTTVVRSVSDPAPSPDGIHIALSWSSGIWIAGTDGSDPHEIIHTSGVDYAPIWSPDGTKIAFTQEFGNDLNVYLANADGTHLQDLTPYTDASTDYAFGWTPDGHILFISDRLHTGGRFLYSMAADGSDVRLANID